MKQAYQKPTLYFENFSLCESLANCDFQANSTQGECVGYIDPDILGPNVIYNDITQGCTRFTPGNGCLNNPIQGFVIFGS